MCAVALLIKEVDPSELSTSRVSPWRSVRPGRHAWGERRWLWKGDSLPIPLKLEVHAPVSIRRRDVFQKPALVSVDWRPFVVTPVLRGSHCNLQGSPPINIDDVLHDSLSET